MDFDKEVERRLRLIQSREIHKLGPGFDALAFMAGIMLELTTDKERPAIPLNQTARGPIRAQMKAVLTHEGLFPSAAERVLDELFDCLEQDPGHDVTSYAVVPTKSRTKTVEDYQTIIRAIRRGE
jgi:hypothetical protein